MVVPDDTDRAWVPRADAEVTLRDMLSHRTGLKAKADLAAEPGVLSREEYVRAGAPPAKEVPSDS